MTKRALMCIGLMLIGCACLIGCDVSTPAGPTVTDSRSVKQGAAKSVAVEMDLDVGDLNLTGGASDLMNAEFRYNIPEWKPDVQYSVKGTRGTLTVRQPRTRGVRFTNTENHWDVRLRDVLPMDLKVRSDTGSIRLDANGLSLTSLAVDTDTGATHVDLDGRHASLRSVSLKGDTGACTVNLTGDYPVLTNLKATTDTGSVTADLSGHWRRNAEVELSTDTGSVTVVLPADIGVQVITHKDTGNVTADGLMVQGDVYTNTAYGKSAITLHVNAHTDTGNVSLRVGER